MHHFVSFYSVQVLQSFHTLIKQLSGGKHLIFSQHVIAVTYTILNLCVP
jgi:hypothetical protein